MRCVYKLFVTSEEWILQKDHNIIGFADLNRSKKIETLDKKSKSKLGRKIEFDFLINLILKLK